MTAPVHIPAAPGLTTRDEDDLRWLLQAEYLGDLGVCSSLGAQLDQLERGTAIQASRRSWDPSDRVLEAASRLRVLTRRWESVDPAHRALLQVLYAEARAPLPGWGSLGAVVLRLELAHHEHRRSRSRKGLEGWLQHVAAKDVDRYARLRARAEAVVAEACEAWRRTSYKLSGPRAREHYWNAARHLVSIRQREDA